MVEGSKISPWKIGLPKRVGCDLVGGQKRAEISGFESIRWRGVAETRQHAGAETRPVDIGEEEGLVFPVVNLRNNHRAAQGKAEGVVAYRSLCARRALPGYVVAVRIEKPARIECIVGEVLVRGSMHVVGAGLGGVFNESAAGVAILSRVGRGDDLHLLNALSRRSALLALLVTDCVTKSGAVEKILRGHGLAAVNARVELAAAEHRVAIRLHGKIAGLDLQHGLGQTNVCRRDDRDIAIILFVDGVADVRRGHLELLSTCLDLHRLRDRAHRQNDVLADGFRSLKHESPN